MDDEAIQTDLPTVGERLRAAREERKLSLEDVAAQTRIPQRHLESIEVGNWAALPAPTYTTGFAKAYATAVGLDRAEIGEQLRGEMGGVRPLAMAPEVFEPADPARTMPRWLVFGAIGAVILLIVVMTWLNERSLDQPDENNAAPVAEAPAPAQQQPATQAAAPAAQGPVVLTAIAPAWIQVSERAGATLFSGILQPGQTFTVPPTATAPLLKTGKAEGLRISVGNTVIPPVGPPSTTVRDVSLLPADLLRTGQASPPAPQSTPPASQAARPQTAAPARSAPPAAPPSAQAPPPPANTVTQ